MPTGKLSASRKVSPRLPNISEAEWVVMKVLWRKAPQTANQVVEALAHQTHWKPKTIHTLLRRLALKKALRFERQGREYLFHPLIEARDYLRAASQSFLQRVFDGRIAPFLACLLEEESLSPEELDELKRILEGNQT
jgi:BlaI family transcriptional regulator, penicillinase repressor